MAAVGALHHEVGRHDCVLPGVRDGADDAVPAGHVRPRDRARIHRVVPDGLQLHGVISDGLADRLYDRRHRLRRIDPDVGDHLRRGRNHVGGSGSLHAGERDRRPDESVQLATALFRDQVDHRAEAPQVREQDLIGEGRPSAQRVKHLRDRRRDLHRQRVPLHLRHRFREDTDRRVRRRRGGVSAGRRGAVAQVHHALFRDADQRALLFYAGEDVLYNSTSLVHDHGEVDILFLKIIDNGDRTGTVGLFSAGEREVDVLLRDEALPDQPVGGHQDPVERNFCIQRSAAPEDAVLDDPLKRRLLPVLFLDGNDVVMRHQDGSF